MGGAHHECGHDYFMAHISGTLRRAIVPISMIVRGRKSGRGQNRSALCAPFHCPPSK